MKKLYSNKEIYLYAQMLSELNESFEDLIPIKANFAIQKNLKNLSDLYDIIEKSRMLIGRKYGELQDDNSYQISSAKIEDAQREMDNLMGIEQNVDITMIALSDLGDIKLTPKQMQALLFMIEE